MRIRDRKMSSDLPQGWATANLESLIEFAIGGAWGVAPDECGDGAELVRVIRGTEFRHWNRDRGATAAIRAVPVRQLEARRLQANDLVVEISGGGPDQPVGRVVLIDEGVLKQSDLPVICSNFCRKLRLTNEVDPQYAVHFMNYLYHQGEFNRFQNQTVNLRNLQFTDFVAEITLSLPPLVEQRRIVAKVDELLGRVNAARERLARVPAILKRFRQSVLAAACSGRLTEDWRNNSADEANAKSLLARIESLRHEHFTSISRTKYPEPIRPSVDCEFSTPLEWPIVSLDALTTLVTSGSRGWAAHYSETGPLFIRAQNVNSDRLVLDDIAHVQPPDSAEGRRTQVQFGDLLVTITGANVTKTGVVDRELDEAYVSQHVALVRPIDPELSRYLHFWVISPKHGREKLSEDAYGAGKPGLNLDNIREMAVALPPRAEQHEIVRRVEALFRLADAVEAKVAAGIARVGKLTQAILAKAFRGELVPTEAELARREGRDFEPASVLLERIRAARAQEAPAKQTARRPRRK